MNRLLMALAFFVAHILMAFGNATYITNQEQFDHAVERINKGETMQLVLRKGQYVLKTTMTATAPLAITSCGAEITTATKYSVNERVRATADHYVYKIHNQLSLYALFYGDDDSLIRVSESVNETMGVNFLEGEIVEKNGYKAGAEIKIPIPSNLAHLKNKNFPRAYGYVDSGWKVVPFELERSDGFYFYCKTLDECPTKDYQYDKHIYKKQTRFVIFNAELKAGAVFYDREWIYVPKELGNFYCLNANDGKSSSATIVSNSDITLKNVGFKGFYGITVNSKSEKTCDISNCTFQYSLGCALKIVKDNDERGKIAKVRGCTFKDCSIFSENAVILKSTFASRPCIEMSECTLTRHPGNDVMYKNASGAIWVDGDVFLNSNVVYNTCRCHMYFNRGKIVAKGNFLFNTDDFNAKANRNLSSDWGLVYCNHIFYGDNNNERALNNKQHQILLEDNLLYGAYAYGGDARGIFIDNGRGDVECNGNIILNTQIYSIDARNSRLIDASSVRNSYDNNIVTSNYRLQSGAAVEGSDIPVTRANFLLTSNDNDTTKVEVVDNDIRIGADDMSFTFSASRIYLSKGLYRIIRKSSAWRKIKKYIKRL